MLSTLLLGFLPAINFYKNPNEIALKNLFNADILQSYRNWFVYRFFNRSLNNNTVVVGKNGYLFLGNKYNYILSNSQDLKPFSKVSINTWLENLSQLQQWYESQGIKFVLAVVPNKHRVYSEYLPNWVLVKNKNLVDTIIGQAKINNSNLLDMSPTLLKHKALQNELIYYKTDSHWNLNGAIRGTKALINYINHKLSYNIKLPKLKIVKKKVQGLGNAKLLKIDKLLPFGVDNKLYYKFQNKSDICHADINPKTLELEPCIFNNKKPYGIHKGAHYFINRAAKNKQRVLILADSFIDSQTHLLSQTFNTIWQFHYSKITQKEIQKFIKRNKPDIVIYQVIERNLFNNKFIKRQ